MSAEDDPLADDPVGIHLVQRPHGQQLVGVYDTHMHRERGKISTSLGANRVLWFLAREKISRAGAGRV